MLKPIIYVNIKNPYLKNFVFACAVAIGLKIALLAFGLRLFNSYSDTLAWIAIFFLFLLVLVLSQLFIGIRIPDLLDGIWAGIVLFSWGQILTLPWFEHPAESLARSLVYVLIGLFVFGLGFFFRKSLDPSVSCKNLYRPRGVLSVIKKRKEPNYAGSDGESEG